MTDHGDQYFTPPRLTRALLARPRWDLKWADDDGRTLTIAEPCAGDGWITRELERAGHTVVAGDVDPSVSCEHAGVDFFSIRASSIYTNADAIVTNPPFSAAPRFVRRAREMVDLVVMLLRLSFLEPCNDRPDSRRADLVQELAHVDVLPRVSFAGGASGTDWQTCGWFYWRGGREADARTTLDVVTDSELERYAGQGDLFEDCELFAAASAESEPGPIETQADMFTPPISRTVA